MTLPTLKSRIAYGYNPSVPTPTYVDVSASLQALRVHRGRSDEKQQPDAGTVRITYRNTDDAFTPPALTLMTKVQHAAVWNNIEYTLHTGYFQDTPISWFSNDESSVTPTAYDATSALQAALVWGDLPEETTGARISRLLDWAGQPTGAGVPGSGYWDLGTDALDSTAILSPDTPTRDIDDGSVTVSATTIATDSPRAALDVIQETASAEPGVFFFDSDGTAIFRGRNARFGLTPSLTFTDDLTSLSSSRAQYQQLAPSYRMDRIVNEVSIVSEIASVSTTVVASDDESRQQYLRRSARYELPLTTETEMQLRAEFELLLYSQPAARYESLSVVPAGQSSAWPALLSLDIGSLVEVERKGVSRPVFIESIDHDITPGDWKITFGLSPADVFVDVWVLGTGALDSTTKLAA